jgi:hypothetical protein
MGKIDETLRALAQIDDPTERALELAGLISTLFKLRGIVLIVTGELAYASYADVSAHDPELELAPLNGKLTPHLLQEIMGGQLEAHGTIDRWNVANILVRFHREFGFALRDLCRDFNTDHGIVKLFPAEEITADRILAAVYPVPNPIAHRQAITLLVNGLTEAFRMDWSALRKLCHHPDYHVGEELAQLRMEAKRRADALGLADPFGNPSSTSNLPSF